MRSFLYLMMHNQCIISPFHIYLSGGKLCVHRFTG